MLPLNLAKAETGWLSKQIRTATMELRWTGGVDCDVFAIALGEKTTENTLYPKMVKDGEKYGLCFFNELVLFNGGITHSGDARNGDGKAPAEADETIKFVFSKIPVNVKEIQVYVMVYSKEGEAPKKFGMLSQLDVSILSDSHPSFKINMADNYGGTSIIKALKLVYDDTKGWAVTPVQEPVEGTFEPLVYKFI